MSDTNKYLAELIGTFVLVFMGCGSAVIAGKEVGFLGIAFAFGLSSPGHGLRNRPHLRLPTSTRPSRLPCS